MSLLLLLFFCNPTYAGNKGHKKYSSKYPSVHHQFKSIATHKQKSIKKSFIKRDRDGNIKRSSQAKHDFMEKHPCPSTGKTSGDCPGYVVDHKIPLKKGGADSPSNMQWQTEKAAKMKDRIE